MDKANILVLGTSGAGKSTLINTVIGKPVAKVGVGKHITENMQSYESDELNIRLIDSRGFEYSFLNTKKAVMDMKTWMKKGLQNESPRIHMMWFCVDATSKRFTKNTLRTMEQVKKEWPDIPIIVVLTKSFFIYEDDDNIVMVKETFEKLGKKTAPPLAVVPVLAEAPKGETGIIARGIEELIEITVNNIDDAVRASEDAVKKYELKRKKITSHVASVGAATAASVVGAIPIDFPDAVILTPLETGLITVISRIYGLDKNEDLSRKIMERIIAAGAVTMVAKTIINNLKLIPTVATNVAADVLNAIVAGSIVFGIGEASTVIMEKVYLGEINADNLNVIDKIVETHMGKMVKNISDIVAKQEGKINVKDILNSLFNKDK